MAWKRTLYLTHRWGGIALGAVVAMWFLSGAVLVFYPWPSLTESARLRLLPPLAPGDSVVGFARARARAAAGEPAGGRLVMQGGRPVYRLWTDRDGLRVPAALVDARTGQLLSPVGAGAAAAAARAVVPAGEVLRVERLTQGDRYTMNRDYAHEFPAWRVRFGDPAATAVYVNERDGAPVAVVTTRTRVTTWLGTVPHWLYFAWLYQRRGLWTWVSVALSGSAVLLAASGVALGLTQLLPRSRRGPRRLTPYQGVSRWHHLAGLGFGLLVLTWTFSGVLQMLGGSNLPRAGQAEAVRGGPIRWDQLALDERAAVRQARGAVGARGELVAVEVGQLAGRPGYRLRFTRGADAWVDARSGEVRRELDAREAGAAAALVIPGAGPAAVDRIGAYDRYYYARAGRELPLPAWRVVMADGEGTAVYLDAVDGAPAGFVDAGMRRTRWLRDALHSFDYPALNRRPALWRGTLLGLLACGGISAMTGVWLAGRRLRRMSAGGRKSAGSGSGGTM